jgi:glycosyltransferase involved in cell wall biosynthesis
MNKFISLTLESLVKQTLLPKVVIVNDNSTDNTADIVFGFHARHPFVSPSEERNLVRLHTR